MTMFSVHFLLLVYEVGMLLTSHLTKSKQHLPRHAVRWVFAGVVVEEGHIYMFHAILERLSLCHPSL